MSLPPNASSGGAGYSEKVVVVGRPRPDDAPVVSGKRKAPEQAVLLLPSKVTLTKGTEDRRYEILQYCLFASELRCMKVCWLNRVNNRSVALQLQYSDSLATPND